MAKKVAKQLMMHRNKKQVGRSHVDYWRERVFRKTFTRNGKRQETSEFSVRIQHGGERRAFNLRTSNRVEAGNRAKRLYQNVVANGWPAVEEKKPKPTIRTVGEYLNAAKQVATTTTKTWGSYERKLRTAVSEMFGIEKSRSRFNYKDSKKGRSAWLDKIHRVKLVEITSNRVAKWKAARLKTSPEKRDSAIRTVNSIIRAAQSIFSDSMSKRIEAQIAAIPFQGVTKEKADAPSYKSTIDAHELIDVAVKELKEPYPEAYAALVLALTAGLRRAEIDCLTWDRVDLDQCVISIEASKHGGVKSRDSTGDVRIDETVAAYLKSQKEEHGEFVIKSNAESRPNASYGHYRCDKVFRHLSAWLRKNGIQAQKPIHDLRKEFGSVICHQAGIYAASMALRHADIQITRKTYLDQKDPAVFRVNSI